MESVLDKSFEIVSSLSSWERYCVLSHIKYYQEIYNGKERSSRPEIQFSGCQNIFLNGYYYQQGLSENNTSKYLDPIFLKLFKSEHTLIFSDQQRKTNKLEDFIERNTVASKLFKLGMDYYKELNGINRVYNTRIF